MAAGLTIMGTGTNITSRSQKFPSRSRDASLFRHLLPRVPPFVGMSDGRRLNSSLDLLKRHYPQVTSLQDYIYGILSNATETPLITPGDPEGYRDLLENSRVGYHQPPSRKYRAGTTVFEIDEVGQRNWLLPPTYIGLGDQKSTMVPPPSTKCCEKYHHRWLQGVVSYEI